MSVITNEKCAERVMTDIMDGQICASDADGASGACVVSIKGRSFIG